MNLGQIIYGNADRAFAFESLSDRASNVAEIAQKLTDAADADEERLLLELITALRIQADTVEHILKLMPASPPPTPTPTTRRGNRFQ